MKVRSAKAKQKMWEKGEVKYLIKHHSSIRSQKIADYLGRSLPSVYYKASKLKLKKSID